MKDDKTLCADGVYRTPEEAYQFVKGALKEYRAKTSNNKLTATEALNMKLQDQAAAQTGG